MSARGQHVLPEGDRWSVRRAGSERASGIYATRVEAVDAARDIARNQRADLYIHGPDGLIRERQSFDDNPAKPKG